MKTIEVIKDGDWALPVLLDGKQILTVQINKDKKDKENIDSILSDYEKAGIDVYSYTGKNDKKVLLVEQSKRLKATRVGETTREKIDMIVSQSLGAITEEQALAILRGKF